MRLTTFMASLTLASLIACAGKAPRFPETSGDVVSGSRRVLVDAPVEIVRGLPARVGFMLVGSPRLYPDAPLYSSVCLIASTGARCFGEWLNPHVSRYYAFTLNGRFTRQEIPRRITQIVVHVELYTFAGYDILGRPHVGELLMRGAKPVRVRDISAGGTLGIHQTELHERRTGGQ